MTQDIPDADVADSATEQVRDPGQLLAIVRLIRPHHWVKNLLLFVPLLASHQLDNEPKRVASTIAFVLFCFAASAIYVVNDLVDADSDRQHPSKRHRPIAAGLVSVRVAWWVATGLALVSVLASYLLMPLEFTYLLLGYIALTLLYSFYLREVLFLDVMLLAGLYGYRIQAGGTAADIDITGWLLAFSGFFFLSVAFAKRYTELALATASEQGDTGRGYRPDDLPLIRSLGPACGYLSVLVLCLYIEDIEENAIAERLYQRPMFLWLIGPVLLFWITRLWFLAHRGELDDDPVVFAMRSPTTYVVGAICLLLMLLASG